MIKKLGICCFLLILGIGISAQDADMVGEILSQKTASVMDFSYLVASATGMDCNPFEAYTYCDRFGSFNFVKAANDPVTVQVVSHFFMNNYGLKGGFEWDLTHSRRSAWKNLKSLGFWESGIDPEGRISGRDLIMDVNRFFSWYPGIQLRKIPAKEASKGYYTLLLNKKVE